MNNEETVFQRIGRMYGTALAQQRDARWAEWVDHFNDPDKYRRCKTTYKGVAAKRRLYMKAGLT